MSVPRNSELNKNKKKKTRKRTPKAYEKFYAHRKTKRIANAKNLPDPLGMTESEVEAFQASLKKQTRAVQPAVQDEAHHAILMNQTPAVATEQETQTPVAVQPAVQDEAQLAILMNQTPAVAPEQETQAHKAVQPVVQDEAQLAILMNQTPAVAPEQETQTPEAVQKSGSESSLNQSSKESFTAMQYRPLGLIKMMFAKRILREEVAMLVQEIAKEVAEDYQAEMTESTLIDLEEVDKQYRPVDSVTMSLQKETFQEEVAQLVEETAQEGVESESLAKQSVQETVDDEPDEVMTVGQPIIELPPPPPENVVHVYRYNLRSRTGKGINSETTKQVIRPRKKKTVSKPSTEAVQTRMLLMQFSNEVIAKILSYLPYHDITNLRRVNKRFCVLANKALDDSHVKVLNFSNSLKEDICEYIKSQHKKSRDTASLILNPNGLLPSKRHWLDPYLLVIDQMRSDFLWVKFKTRYSTSDNFIYGKMIDTAFHLLNMMRLALKLETPTSTRLLLNTVKEYRDSSVKAIRFTSNFGILRNEKTNKKTNKKTSKKTNKR